MISPQDVVAEFECDHKVQLAAAAQAGNLTWREEPDPTLDLLREQGLAHERARLDALRASTRVVVLGAPAHSVDAYSAAWRATAAAMDDEADAIYQATLFTGDFVGFADFLLLARDETGAVIRDDAGRAVYDPVDTKSARSAKRAAVLQVASYADALTRLGRPAPQRIHLWLAGTVDWSARADHFTALAARLREQVTERVMTAGPMPTPDWAAPREACARCRFAGLCEAGRRRDRDLSLVQGIRSSTRQRLVDAGLPTIDMLATAPGNSRPTTVSGDTFERLRAQAALQIAGEQAGRVLFEVVDPRVLASLPARTPGDLWFDMEGDPYAPGPAGLEYMFGYGFLHGGGFDFATTEASDAATERLAFEAFIDLVMDRWAEHPGMHVYHYADYERRTLQRLAQQHGTRELEVDRILQGGVLIDLYRVVQRALRFSTESLSLKDIEGVYGVTHKGEDVSTAMDSVLQYERVIALRAEGRHAEAETVLQQIRSYNALDCESTMLLDDWLRTLTPGAVHDAPTGPPVLAGTGGDRAEGDGAGGDGPDGSSDPHATLITALQQDLPVDAAARTEVEQARALLAAALQYHPRERRPAWWQLFELIKAEPEELQAASDVLTIDRVEVSDWHTPPRARKERRDVTVSNDREDPRTILDAGGQAFLLYDEAPFGMARPADAARGYHPATVHSVGEDSVLLTEVAGRDGETWVEAPIAVLPGPPVNTDPIRNAIAAAAAGVVPSQEDGPWVFPHAAWADLLLARPPRTGSGRLPNTGDAIVDICDALQDSDDSYVAVQGPPGTGKTYVGSRAVAQLAALGWRIGVVAQSHAVVDNFLEAVHDADARVPVGKEPQGGRPGTAPWHVDGKIDAWAARQRGGWVIGGTAWVFSRAAVRALDLDLLVIDEAGQFALANAIACAATARRVLLLGDPQQLPQVSQAAHPEAIEQSVLERVIGGHATMPADRGYFLAETYRMHPALTRAVSRLQYEGRLGAAPVTAQRRLDGITPGVVPVPVPHGDNTTSSPQEAQAVARLVRDLVGRTWVGASHDRVHAPRPLTLDDVIIVAAYNAQVRLLRRVLADAGFDGIQVGTVDKFQGREEAVVIVSMATSSAEESPRGIEFLLSPNRLNVAISRAQWASFVVHSPALLDATPPSVEGLARLGGFLTLLEPPDHGGEAA